jgi:hypothetical protein
MVARGGSAPLVSVHPHPSSAVFFYPSGVGEPRSLRVLRVQLSLADPAGVQRKKTE